MLRLCLLASCALAIADPASGQDLQQRPDPTLPAPAVEGPPPVDPKLVQFSADTLEYDNEADVVTALGEVRMTRDGNRLRADKVVWNRQTGQVVASGGVAVANPQGDIAYGDTVELTDTLKGGVVDNMLVVLDRGGRFAAARGRREDDGTLQLERAAYTPCPVTNVQGCPKEPSWKITAVRVTYRPERERIYFVGGRFHLLGLPTLPLPRLSMPVGGASDSGLLSPNLRFSGLNGLEVMLPYYLALAPNRGLTLTPHLYSRVLPMAQVQYDALGERGAFRVTGYATVSRRSEDLSAAAPTTTEQAFRGYLDGIARYQLSPHWSASGSLRRTTDRTFLRRYEISRDDRLRSTARLERVDADSYFALTGWAVQTLRLADAQGQQPVALPELDVRHRFTEGLLGGRVELQGNTLALSRTAGQDTQRAFASARWDLRRLTRWGQEVTFTAFGRGDLYNTRDTALTRIASYRGLDGFQSRAIGALAADVRWPLIGPFGSGTQRITPRLQIVASPGLANLRIPNEDSRAVDLEDSNLFSLNRFSGHDRWEDSTRATYGVDWLVELPGIRVNAVVGQSYRLTERPSILPEGTGLADRFSDIVGRTELRIRDAVSIVHRYRFDKDGFAIRRNEIDATVGSRDTYLLLGYLRLNRNILQTVEDLPDREEARIAGRVQFRRFWSAFGSAVVDLTNRAEDPLSLSNGFSPIRHRLGVQYEDDCLRIGLTWRRDYQNLGDARAANSVLFTLAFANPGR